MDSPAASRCESWSSSATTAWSPFCRDCGRTAVQRGSRSRSTRACCCTSTLKAAVPRRLLPRCCAGSDWSPMRTRISRSLSERDGESAIAGPDQALRDRLASFVSLKGLPRLPVDVARKINDLEAAGMFGPVEHGFAVEGRGIARPGGDLRGRDYRAEWAGRLPGPVYFP